MCVAVKAFAVNAFESLNSSPFVGLYKRPTNARRKTPFARLSLRFTSDYAVVRKLKKVEEKVEEEKVEEEKVEIVAWEVFLAWAVCHQAGE